MAYLEEKRSYRSEGSLSLDPSWGVERRVIGYLLKWVDVPSVMWAGVETATVWIVSWLAGRKVTRRGQG